MNDEIQSIGLGPQLDTRSLESNPWIHVIEMDLTRLLAAWPHADSVRFAITENEDIRAVARLDKRYIVITFGLLDQICKLAAAAVSQGVFVGFGDTKPEWRPRPDAPKQIGRQLGLRPFRWSPEELPWIAEFERQMIFLHMIMSMSRFIFFHELGHIVHDHGRSGSARGARIIEMADGPNLSLPTNSMIHELQAKELAADTYALEAILYWLEAEFGTLRDDEAGALLQTQLLSNKLSRARWALMSSYFVFRLLDRQDHTPETVRARSHPPAAFRLRYLFGHALVRGVFGLNEHETADEILSAISLSDAVMAVALDRLPEPQWLREHSSQYDELFMSLYKLVPKWRRLRA